MLAVADCSVTLSWVFPDEATATTDALRDSLLGGLLVVPALWAIEMGNGLLVALRRQRIDEGALGRILGDLAALPIEADPLSAGEVRDRALPFALSHRLSLYDAIYLELAHRLRVPLATLDRSLRTAARREGVEVL